MPRRTKIIATVGPASESEPVLRGLIRAGMDVARLGMAHSSLEENAERLALIPVSYTHLTLPTILLV